MNNLFTWCHGSLKLEISSPIKTNPENFTYNLKIDNTSNGYSKIVECLDASQIDDLKECLSTLNSRDYQKHGCLVDSLTLLNENEPNIIKAFRNSYRTTVSTDDERLSSNFIDITRYDYDFKHSELEPANTKTNYSLVFGFQDVNFPSYCELFEIKDLSFDQISNFIDDLSIFINN